MNYLANGKETVSLPIISGTHPVAMPEPESSEKRNWIIHLQHLRGETNSCKELIRNEIVRSAGKNEFAYFKQGMILREEGKTQEALETFQICTKLNPRNGDNIKEVAKCLYEMRRFRLALEGYLEAEKLSRNNDWQTSYHIGQCLLRLGDISKAKEYAFRAVQLGKHEFAYTLLIKILIAEGDLRAAVNTSNAAVESCPDNVAMLTECGLLCLKNGRIQYAFDRLSSALALDPCCTKALLGIGCITQNNDEHDVALTKYKLAVSCDPNSVALWNNIGMCFHSKQKHIAAISCLKRAQWLCAIDWRVLFNLGMVHLSNQQPASAFNFLCAAVNLRPDFVHSFTALGCALIQLKDAENATRAFRQATHLAQDDLVALIDQVFAFTLLGLTEEGRNVMEEFKSFAKNNETKIPTEIMSLASELDALLSATCIVPESEKRPGQDESIEARTPQRADNADSDKDVKSEFPASDRSIKQRSGDDELV